MEQSKNLMMDISYLTPSSQFRMMPPPQPLVPTPYQQATLTELLTKKERICSARPVGGNPPQMQQQSNNVIKRVPLAKRYTSRPSIQLNGIVMAIHDMNTQKSVDTARLNSEPSARKERPIQVQAEPLQTLMGVSQVNLKPRGAMNTYQNYPRAFSASVKRVATTSNHSPTNIKLDLTKGRPIIAPSSPRLHYKGRLLTNFRIASKLSRQKSSKLKAQLDSKQDDIIETYHTIHPVKPQSSTRPMTGRGVVYSKAPTGIVSGAGSPKHQQALLTENLLKTQLLLTNRESDNKQQRQRIKSSQLIRGKFYQHCRPLIKKDIPAESQNQPDIIAAQQENPEKRNSLKDKPQTYQEIQKECIFQKKNDGLVQYDPFHTDGEEDPDMLRVEDICEGADWQALATPSNLDMQKRNKVKMLASYKLDLRAVQKSYNGEREEEIVGFMIHSSHLFSKKTPQNSLTARQSLGGGNNPYNTAQVIESPRSLVSSPKSNRQMTSDFVNYCRMSTGGNDGGGSPTASNNLGNTYGPPGKMSSKYQAISLEFDPNCSQGSRVLHMKPGKSLMHQRQVDKIESRLQTWLKIEKDSQQQASGLIYNRRPMKGSPSKMRRVV
ncbi:hypothetical protein FGO68_gene11673 [Halteria grandinella]|uniref:Uncharacterized protein n=1 Tax=Halteria grandinella TaxID=5974 RepID=A0A8J8NYU5_HALGN|nr:hypothetical protein FGO68_gene11673 [Halteria grandinella]